MRIWNRYFEAFPISLVKTAVTEDEALPSDALTRLRNGLAVPPALARWAASRG